jgi:hypothetical protein
MYKFSASEKKLMRNIFVPKMDEVTKGTAKQKTVISTGFLV